MKITLEFDNAEKFFTELAQFSELMGLARQHVTFNHVPKATTDPAMPVAGKPADDIVKTAQKAQEAPREKKTEDLPKEQEKPKEEPKPKADEGDLATKLRAELNKLMKSGKKDEVKALLKEFGASKFGEVKPENYKAMLDKAAELQEGED